MVATPAIDFHYNIVFPETMHELMMDSDEEGGGEFKFKFKFIYYVYRSDKQ